MAEETPPQDAPATWVERAGTRLQRARQHKVMQWALGYVGGAFVLAQVEQLLAQTYDWPPVVGRIFITALLAFLPVAVTIAWYQGYQGLKRFSRTELAAITGLLMAGVGVLFFFAVPHNKAGPAADTIAMAPGRIAVLPLRAAGGGATTQEFGRTLAETIIARLNDSQVQTIAGADAVALNSAARDSDSLKLGADFILSGSVDSGQPLKVTVHLDRASTHATVWSDSYEQSVSESAKFQARIAGSVSEIVQAAVAARRADPAEMDDAALGIWLKITANSHVDSGPLLFEERELARQMIARTPRFSQAWSAYAIVSALSLDDAAPADRPALVAEAKKAAARALAIDPKDATAYLALATSTSQDHWAEREAILRKGLAAVPGSADLNAYLADVYFETGRIHDAVEPLRRAQVLDPTSPPKIASLAQALVTAGRATEARKVMDNAYALWPGDADVWFARFDTLAEGGFPDDALAMMDAANGNPANWEPPYVAAWRAYLKAIKSHALADRTAALAAVRAAREAGKIGNARAVLFFAGLGDADDAFDSADKFFASPGGHSRQATELLFNAQTRAMRADKRFMPLAARLGLVVYWTQTGNWPDFCAEPGLLYDCRAAAKAAAQPTP